MSNDYIFTYYLLNEIKKKIKWKKKKMYHTNLHHWN